MEIYGREYSFRLTVGAACDIAELCPDKQLQNFGKLLQGAGFGSATEGRAAFICALSRGEEEARAFETPGYKPEPITPELLRALSLKEFGQALAEATEAFASGLETTVGVAPDKKKDAGDTGSR